MSPNIGTREALFSSHQSLITYLQDNISTQHMRVLINLISVNTIKFYNPEFRTSGISAIFKPTWPKNRKFHYKFQANSLKNGIWSTVSAVYRKP